MKLKHALIAAKQKQHDEKYNFRCINLSQRVGPYASVTEKYYEYKDGNVRCDFGMILNKKHKT